MLNGIRFAAARGSVIPVELFNRHHQSAYFQTKIKHFCVIVCRRRTNDITTSVRYFKVKMRRCPRFVPFAVGHSRNTREREKKSWGLLAKQIAVGEGSFELFVSIWYFFQFWAHIFDKMTRLPRICLLSFDLMDHWWKCFLPKKYKRRLNFKRSIVHATQLRTVQSSLPL